MRARDGLHKHAKLQLELIDLNEHDVRYTGTKLCRYLNSSLFLMNFTGVLLTVDQTYLH